MARAGTGGGGRKRRAVRGGAAAHAVAADLEGAPASRYGPGDVNQAAAKSSEAQDFRVSFKQCYRPGRVVPRWRASDSEARRCPA